MALDRTKMHKITEGLFRYNATADTIATVIASGYFNAITHLLKQDDLIVVIGNNRGTIDTIFVNSATNAATVTTVAVEGSTAT